MSLIHEITRQIRQPVPKPASSPLPDLEPAEALPPAVQTYAQVMAMSQAMAPAPLTTIEISRHHASGGYVAVFAGDRGIGQTPLEALGKLVEQGSFGALHVLDRT